MSAEDFDPSKPLLDRRRERFCQELMAGTPLYDAYVEAGFARPRGNAQRMEQEPEVSRRLNHLRSQVEKYEPVLLAFRRVMVRRRLDNIVDVDRFGLFEEYRFRGKRKLRLKPVDQLTAEQRALVENIEVTKDGVRLTMPSRLGALAQIRDMDGFRGATKLEGDMTMRIDPVQEILDWIAANETRGLPEEAKAEHGNTQQNSTISEAS